MEDSLSQIPDAIVFREGLPRPKWDVIYGWAETNVAPASLDESWTQIARDWLTRLADSLPRDYALHESPEFLLLAADNSLGQRILSFSERARRVILKTLNGVASDQGFGKHVVLLFADTESYYDYVTDFYPDEGEFALSGGMFLDVGYGHFAICPAYGDDYERVYCSRAKPRVVTPLTVASLAQRRRIAGHRGRRVGFILFHDGS